MVDGAWLCHAGDRRAHARLRPHADRCAGPACGGYGGAGALGRDAHSRCAGTSARSPAHVKAVRSCLICSDASRTLHSITNEPVFATFIGAHDSGSVAQSRKIRETSSRMSSSSALLLPSRPAAAVRTADCPGVTHGTALRPSLR